MTNLHVLMTDFLQLEGAVVGRGYKHPTEPNPAVRDDTLRFLEAYPFLRQDQGYINFLECYAGARAWEDAADLADDDLLVDLFGLIDGLSTHLIYGDGPVVDEQGYLFFCGGHVRQESRADRFPWEVITQGFAFDATGQRRWGVYRDVGSGEVRQAGKQNYTYWYCATFLEWLELLIKTQGRMPDRLD